LPDEVEFLSEDDALLLPPDFELPFDWVPLVDAMLHSSF